MGNSACHNNINQPHDHQMSRNNSKQSNKNNHVDDFFIKLHHYQQKQKILNNISEQQIISDQRRVVFVSLLGLYQTYLLCPAPILYSAIFIVPIKKEWIYYPEQYTNELNKSIIKTLTIFQNETDWNNFVCLLKWKDSQNLVIWAHNQTINDQQSLVSEFWINFNNKLIKLYDPTTKSKYNPIILDRQWWQFDYDISKSKYKPKRYQILKELFFSTKEFKPMMEIIYQSNPSLNPIISYQLPKEPLQSVVFENFKQTPLMPFSECQSNGFVNTYKNEMDIDGFVALDNKALCGDIVDEDEDLDVDNEGEWVISMDYNEYDIY